MSDQILPAGVRPFASMSSAPSVWAAVGLIAIYFALQVVVGLMLVALVKLGYGVVPAAVQQQPATKAAVAAGTVCIAALVVALLAHRRWPALWSRATPPGLGLVRPPRLRWLPWAVGIGLLAPLLGAILTQLLAHGHELTQNVEQLGLHAPLPARLALALVAVGIGPMVEELLFRGVLLSALIPRCGVRAAAMISAAGFALIHLPGVQWQWYVLPQLLLLGVALAWLRLHFQSLWPAVLAHGTHNALAVVAWFSVFSIPG